MVDRGTILTVTPGGGTGHKPRPAVVVQASGLDFPSTLVVVPLTSQAGADLHIKPVFLPDDANGLHQTSSMMTHRITAIRHADIGDIVGKLSEEDMMKVDEALITVLGLDRR